LRESLRTSNQAAKLLPEWIVAKQRVLFGTIVLADVADPNGNPAGPHPAVVLNRQDEIDAGDDLWVAVCSTSFGYPLRSGWFDMPTQPGGHPATGLTEACVVKATWLQTVPQAKVIRLYKRAPVRIVKQVLDWLQNNGIPK
jgi:PemK-like, MazF-like toxin of type II toxin-antitoxin system